MDMHTKIPFSVLILKKTNIPFNPFSRLMKMNMPLSVCTQLCAHSDNCNVKQSCSSRGPPLQNCASHCATSLQLSPAFTYQSSSRHSFRIFKMRNEPQLMPHGPHSDFGMWVFSRDWWETEFIHGEWRENF